MHTVNLFPFIGLLLLGLTACQQDDDATPECSSTEEEQEVITALDDLYAYPFAGAQPGVTDEQLTPLVDFLGAANFVGLGEATHGTREFYQFKDQLFRLLVEEKGFKAIIFEIPWGNAWVVNEFVTKGIGTADGVVNQTVYWTYDTQEVRDLVQWMHDYNLGRDEADKIHFVGCDAQGSHFNVERALVCDYLEKVQPDSVLVIADLYRQLPQNDLFSYTTADASIKEFNRLATQRAYQYLLDRAVEFIAASSAWEYELALMAAHLIQHREYLYRRGDFGQPRDSLMAVYAEWWQQALGTGSQVALWAHNFHVMDARGFNVNSMGSYLTRRHAEAYRPVGFSFGTGTFNAFLAAENVIDVLQGVQRQEVEQVICPSSNHLLNQVKGEQHYLIFPEISGTAATYFFNSQPFLQLGAGFNVTYIDNYIQRRSLSKQFDVLIHFDSTTASVLR